MSKKKVENCRTAQWTCLQEWHERFGHLNESDLKDIIKKKKVTGVNFNTNVKLQMCETCVKGKQAQRPFPRSNTRSSELLELIHTDVCGPMRVNSLGGSRYFLTFIDDKSKWCEVYFLKHKSEVLEKFKEYKSMVEKRTGRKIKAIRSDNGTEYTNNAFKNYLKKEGIKHEFTVEYTPQQNGVAERKNRTLVEMARCMMIQSGLAPSFWAEAILTANHIRNRCPSRSLDGEIPFKIWTKRRPVVSYFQKFGTTVYMLDKSKRHGKFEPKSKKCIFIGYSIKSKSYRLWDPQARKVVCSRDVKFTNFCQPENDYTDFIGDEQSNDEEIISQSEREPVQNEPDTEVEVKDEEVVEQPENEENCNEDPAEQDEVRAEDSESSSEEEEEFHTPLTTKRGPGRPKKLLTGKRGRPRKLFNEVRVEGTEQRNQEVNVASLIDENDPVTVENAMESSEANNWKKAMKSEFEALKRNKTWEVVHRPKNQKLVDSKWVLRKKYKSDGTVERYKARLVAKGFTQMPGVDFNETFAPVARIGSIRLVMALAAEMKLDVYQLDFVTAYLNGDIDETIYMKIPDELFKICKESELGEYQGDKVCLLKKALYGLKQSGRQWYKKLDEKLQQLHLKPLDSDPCVYLSKSGKDITLVAIYVDDLIVATNNKKKWFQLKTELAKSFEMKDLGRLNFCLGIEFKQDPETKEITMSQQKYVQTVLKRFNMSDCKPVSTPLNIGLKLSKEMCPQTEEEKEEVKDLPYQNLVGSLMYLATSTRPDIAHAVSVLSQYNTNYGKQHWIAGKRVLRYLKGTANYGLHFKKANEPLVGYADADWGSNIDDRRSYTGFAFKLSNASVSWDSRKQRTVAMSSTEAEYMSLSDSTKEAIHLRRFLIDIIGHQETTIIFNDNQGAGLLSKNPIFHNRTKHMDVRHHFVRQNVMEKNINVEYLSTEEMPADVLTKSLSSPKHNKCVGKLGLVSINN